ERRPQLLVSLAALPALPARELVRRDFVATCPNELRTPIAAIKVMAETLRDGAIDDPAAARDFVARIEEEIDGLYALVEELLDLSRLESGRVEVKLAPTSPDDLVASAVHRLAPLAERAGVTLQAEGADATPGVLADRERM